MKLHYEKEGITWNRLMPRSTDWERNLDTIVQWSPYSSEADLLLQVLSLSLSAIGWYCYSFFLWWMMEETVTFKQSFICPFPVLVHLWFWLKQIELAPYGWKLRVRCSTSLRTPLCSFITIIFFHLYLFKLTMRGLHVLCWCFDRT